MLKFPEGKTPKPSDTYFNGGIHLKSPDGNPAKRGDSDPGTSSPSHMLLEALQNFVIPLIHAADGENKKDISQVDLGLEAGKLLTALQEFISSMIMQSQVNQPQGIEVDLEAPAVDKAPSDNSINKFPDAEAGSTTGSYPRPLADVVLKTGYRSLMGRIPEAVREHVFSRMPIRLLHFNNASRDSGTKLQITLLDRNGVCGRVIEQIQANYSEKIFEEGIGFYSEGVDHEQSIEDRIIEELVWENTKYAILSHTWLRGSDSELTYDTWQLGKFDARQPGYQKLANFCKSAWKDHGLTFGWMDTVCINKDSSSELDESIRSMYKWYKSSAICIAYQAETVTLPNMHHDPWFTRGWTFQELLAPKNMTFYNKDWKKFVLYTYPGDKSNPDILDQISKATTITEEELYSPNNIPISRKMQLAARRKVMREEDIAYSLMGVCNVSISIAYGEGAERAFFRLMTEVLNTSTIAVEIFNCAQKGGPPGSSIIPSAPSAYLHCSKDIMGLPHYLPMEPLLLTHLGLRTPILLMPSLRGDDPRLENNSIGDYYAKLHLPALNAADMGAYHLLDKGIATKIFDRRPRWTFGILNFGENTISIGIPDRCLAVCFWGTGQLVEWDSTSSGSQQVGTKEPIVFQLKNRKRPALRDGRNIYSLKRSELATHGMTLSTMYL